MTKLWNRLKNGRQFSSRNNEKNWQSYYEEEPDYSWIKKTVAALSLFALVYGAQMSNTRIGQDIAGGVRQILATQTDFAYYTNRAVEYVTIHWPNVVNLPSIPVLKQVQTTISRSADPLRYMKKPVAGQIITQYGWQTNPAPKPAVWHEGIVIAASVGDSVQAAADGRIKDVIDSAQLGKILRIDHGQSVETLYGHVSDVLVKEGDLVSQGQVIAHLGKIDSTAMSELYFELRENGKAVDPLSRIKGESAK
jgi:murein DD-endopeptidase MepM/ murein hydrolase activator NlpD